MPRGTGTREWVPRNSRCSGCKGSRPTFGRAEGLQEEEKAGGVKEEEEVAFEEKEVGPTKEVRRRSPDEGGGGPFRVTYSQQGHVLVQWLSVSLMQHCVVFDGSTYT